MSKNNRNIDNKDVGVHITLFICKSLYKKYTVTAMFNGNYTNSDYGSKNTRNISNQVVDIKEN